MFKRRSLSDLAVCLVGVALLASCQGNGDSKSAAQVPQEGTTGAALASLGEIQPLDDPDNPYAEKYQEWDFWNAQNAVAVTAPGVSPESLYDFPTGDPQITGHTVALDQNGYLLPLTEYCRLFEESKISEAGLDLFLSLRRVSSLGKMDPALYARSVDAYEEARAAFYAPIPAWIGENPPLTTVLLPNGEIVTKGMPGSGVEGPQPVTEADSATLDGKTVSESESCCGGDANNPGWFRYSADGTLLGSTNRDFWWYLYFDPDLQELPVGKLRVTNDGYALFTDPESGALLTVLDWDGSELPTVKPPKRAVQPFAHLTSRRVQSYYSAQQRILAGTATPGVVMQPVGLEAGGQQ